MKLELNKAWFEKRIEHESTEVGVGIPPLDDVQFEENPDIGAEQIEEFVETLAFGTLIEFLRRDRQLSIDRLANEARVDVAELLNIEFDAKYIPKPRCVHQLAQYFGLPPRSLLKLSNVTTVHGDRLRDAAARFAANSSTIATLSREERVALTEFVEFLSSQE